MWRGSSSLAEKMASGLQKVPMLVTGSLLFGAPLSCGAAALVAGAAFYAFMLSKMYEEYLEDYVYKLMAKVASRVCRMFENKKATKEDEINLVKADFPTDLSSQIVNDEFVNKNDKENKNIDETNQIVAVTDKLNDNASDSELVAFNSEKVNETREVTSQNECKIKNKLSSDKHSNVDEDLNNLNFHMMMFSMWSVVTLVNIPALLTWARNFSYSVVLKPDTSYHTGLVMSVCSAYIWQLDGPKKNLKHYDAISALLFTMAVFILVLGPLSLTVVNYGVTFMFTIITVQQMWDTEDDPGHKTDINNEQTENADGSNPSTSNDDCDVCNENRIFNIFSKLREKFDFTENNL